MKILLVGGNFDLKNGKESGLINKMYNYLKENNEVKFYNGGNYNNLNEIIKISSTYEIIFWFASVANNLKKVRNVKEYAPYSLLVTSKRNDH